MTICESPPESGREFGGLIFGGVIHGGAYFRNFTVTACVKQICVLGVICRVSDRKTLSNENVGFVGNVCYQHLLFIQNISPILIG